MMPAWRSENPARLIGALLGALVAALILSLLLVATSATGSRFVMTEELLGFAFSEGPLWLGPAVAAGCVIVAALAGAWLAPQAVGAWLLAAIEGVLVIVSGYVVWTLVWNAARLAAEGGLLVAPFLAIHAALFALVGLLLPAIVLFLPAGLLWAAAVRATVRRVAAPFVGRR